MKVSGMNVLVFAFLIGVGPSAGVSNEEEEPLMPDMPDPDTASGMPESEEAALTEEHMRGIHKRLDADGNGKVSLAELMAFAKNMESIFALQRAPDILEEIDADGDGKLSLDEILEREDAWMEDEEDIEDEAERVAARHALEANKFAAADKNGDKLLEVSEVAAMFFPDVSDEVTKVVVDHSVKNKDKNGDGVLNFEEFWHSTGAGDMEDDDEQKALDMEEFSALDLNGDGLLSSSELHYAESGTHTAEKVLKTLFLVDTDKDEHITAEELATERQQLAGTAAYYRIVGWLSHHGEL
mmetsp:Transcript_13494/g.29614  ORF Transcript_13494/g.29614 Transcript_13494/m.29614 type:complete len:297 (+) Transcript_13494:73-963(+)